MRVHVVMIILCLFLMLVGCQTDYEINLEGKKIDRNYSLKKVDGKRQVDVNNKEK